MQFSLQTGKTSPPTTVVSFCSLYVSNRNDFPKIEHVVYERLGTERAYHSNISIYAEHS